MDATFALPHLYRGIALIHLKRHSEALSAFDQALTLQPEFPEALYYRGITYLQEERYDEAITAFNQALVLSDQYSEVFHH
jgi:tetratricopeptide (TPR) repeat protein